MQNRFSNFYAILAHSLGVLYSCYSLKHGTLQTQKLVCISGVCELKNTIHNFLRKYQLNSALLPYMKTKLENQFAENDIWQEFSAHMPPQINCDDMLIIHDKDDTDVVIRQSELLFEEYQGIATFYQTKQLGHLRILLSDEVLGVIDNYLI